MLIYLFFGTGFVWGALAVWFVQPSWVGIGISSLLVVWAYTFTLSKRRKSAMKLAEAVDFLVEGSPAYKEGASVHRSAAKDFFKNHIAFFRSPHTRIVFRIDGDISNNTHCTDHPDFFPDRPLPDLCVCVV